MSSLLSLPRLRRAGLNTTSSVASRLHPKCTPSVRRALSQRLAWGLQSGRLRADQVRQAVAGGDMAVAELVWTMRRRLPVPRISIRAAAYTSSHKPSINLTPEQHANIRLLFKVLARDGDLDRRVLAGLAEGPSWTGIIEAMRQGWSTRIRRVLRRFSDFAKGSERLIPTIFIRPIILEQLEHNQWGPHPYLSTDCGFGLALAPTYFFAQALPADPITQPEWFVLLRKAINQISQATRLPVLPWVFDDPIEWMGFHGELLMDAALSATWEGDRCIVKPDALANLHSEFGHDDIEMLQSEVESLARYHRAITRLGKRRKSSIQRSALTDPQRNLLDRLAALKAMLPRARGLPDVDLSQESGTQGMPGPHYYVAFNSFCLHAEEMWASAFQEDEPFWALTTTDQSPRKLGAFLDRAILEAGVSALVQSEILAYVKNG